MLDREVKHRSFHFELNQMFLPTKFPSAHNTAVYEPCRGSAVKSGGSHSSTLFPGDLRLQEKHHKVEVTLWLQLPATLVSGEAVKSAVDALRAKSTNL